MSRSLPLDRRARAGLVADAVDARARTLALVEDLSDERWLGPRLAVVNPPRWEVGHVGWFQERWVLRHAAGRAPLRPDADALYDSSTVPHRVRWDLPLPDRAATLRYLADVLDATLARLDDAALTEDDAYFFRLATAHEDMHGEALAYTRQTLGDPDPGLPPDPRPPEPEGLPDEVAVDGGTFWLGAPRTTPFVLDNEKWAHRVEVAPFRLATRLVTEGELAAFVDDGGYARRALWTDEGWAWREQAGAG